MALNIAIFASGSGSNAERLFHHFSNTPDFRVSAIFCNNPQAYVLERAKKLGVDAVVFGREEFKSEHFLEKLRAYQVDFIVLAGFLWKIPDYLIRHYPNRIVNIHPALLPGYGGKGMYGDKVHCAVIANKESTSGITIHLVNENYDEGRIIFQAQCDVLETDTADSLARKIHELEYKYFPIILEDYLREILSEK